MNPNLSPQYRPDALSTVALSAAATLLAANTLGITIPIGEHYDRVTQTQPAPPTIPAPQPHTIHEFLDTSYGPTRMPFAPHFSDSPEARRVQPADVSRVIQGLQSMAGASSIKVEIASFASDETAASPDGGLGKEDVNNAQLAKTRGQAFINLLVSDMKTAKNLPANISVEPLVSEEVILSDAQISEIDKLAIQNNMTRRELLDAYDADQELPTKTQQFLHGTLAESRGVMTEITGYKTTTVTPPVTPVLPPTTTTRVTKTVDRIHIPPLLVAPLYRRKDEDELKDAAQKIRIAPVTQEPVISTELTDYTYSPGGHSVGKELAIIDRSPTFYNWYDNSRNHDVIDVEFWEVPDLPAAEQLAITTGRLAIEAAPSVLELTAIPERLAIEAAPRRLELMPAPAKEDVNDQNTQTEKMATPEVS